MTASNSGQGRPTQMPSSAPGKAGTSQWDRVAAMDEFRSLLKARVSSSYLRRSSSWSTTLLCRSRSATSRISWTSRVLGPVNLAYLFALSQFFMAWIIAWLYVRAARKFDILSEQIHEKLESGRGGAVAMNTTLVLFLAFIAVTLGITAWASRRSGSSASYFAANRQNHGVAERSSGRRRLHERRIVPRHRRHDRVLRL